MKTKLLLLLAVLASTFGFVAAAQPAGAHTSTSHCSYSVDVFYGAGASGADKVQFRIENDSVPAGQYEGAHSVCKWVLKTICRTQAGAFVTHTRNFAQSARLRFPENGCGSGAKLFVSAWATVTAAEPGEWV